MRRPVRTRGLVCAVLLLAAVVVVFTQLPALGAAGLLHPIRRSVVTQPPASCENAVFSGVGIELTGWRCGAATTSRGTLVYLHGIADNRASAVGIIQRFRTRGFDVVAYDSRAHGESGGAMCTYGFLEKEDLRRVLDTIEQRPIVLVGTSLGAAVALQYAATTPRADAVVAAETFSDLRRVAAERAPFFFTAKAIARAFQIAEESADFVVDAVSPEAAAATITVPVLLIHGELDVDTSADHSRRVFARLAGPKHLIIVPGAAHNASLNADVWQQIEHWIDNAINYTTRYRSIAGIRNQE